MPRLDRRELAAIFAGGAVGALIRVALERIADGAARTWPWPTFAVNMIGAFLLGLFATRLQERLPLSACLPPAPGHGAVRGADHVWGFHGDHAPHGDRLLQLGRHVPVVTIVVDTPEGIARSFPIVDEVTSERGLVTSEVPALAVLGGHEQRRGRLRLARRHA